VGNDYIHPVDFHNLTSAIEAAADFAITNVYDPSDLLMFETTGEWDTRIQDGYYGARGLLGWHDCPPSATQGGSHPDHWCADGLIRINLTYDHEFNSTNLRRSLLCHEIGHAVGLRHTGSESTGSCLDDDTPHTGKWGLTSHEYGHINNQY
jgi:hypothetical protein